MTCQSQVLQNQNSTDTSSLMITIRLAVLSLQTVFFWNFLSGNELFSICGLSACYYQENFQMPDVRLAATGMDSCPASDEDTEDELESARRISNAARSHLLPSTSRQLVRKDKAHHRPKSTTCHQSGSSKNRLSGINYTGGGE